MSDKICGWSSTETTVIPAKMIPIGPMSGSSMQATVRRQTEKVPQLLPIWQLISIGFSAQVASSRFAEPASSTPLFAVSEKTTSRCSREPLPAYPKAARPSSICSAEKIKTVWAKSRLMLR